MFSGAALAWRHVAAGLMALLYSMQIVGCNPGYSEPASTPDEAKRSAGAMSRDYVSWPMNNIVSTSTQDGVAAGSTAGSADVGTDGSSQYTIPLWVPDGRAGLQPELSLNYNSNGGNGLVGVGWSLNGLSRISRCPKIFAADGQARQVDFSSQDTFCLDGMRLIPYISLDNGETEYRTEIDSFSKIVSFATDSYGPLYFKVYLKDGRIMTMGDTSGPSNATLDGTRAHVVVTTDPHSNAYSQSLVIDQYVRLSWAVARIEDRSGNFLSVTYDNAVGGSSIHPLPASSTGREQLPTEIQYTGSLQDSTVPMSRSVKFFYDARQDAQTHWVSGFELKQTRLLTRVEIDGPKPDVMGKLRTYHLRYAYDTTTARALMKEFQECDGEDVCLPSTTFDWTPGSASYSSRLVQDDVGIGGHPDTAYNLWNLYVNDVDGDGRDDVIYNVKEYYQGEQYTGEKNYLQLTTAQGAQLRQGIDPIPWAGGSMCIDDVNRPIIVQDVDGDGRADMMARICSSDYKQYKTQRLRFGQTGLEEISDNGYEPFAPIWGPSQDPANVPKSMDGHVVDLDGDGLNDLVRGEGLGGCLRYRRNNHGVFDSNYAPLTCAYDDEYLLHSASGYSQFPNCSAEDVLGRGASSMVCLRGGGERQAAPYSWLMATSLGLSGRVEFQPLGLMVDADVFVSAYGRSWAQPMFVDLNADGLPDIVAMSPVWDQSAWRLRADRIAVAINTGNGFKNWEVWPVQNGTLDDPLFSSSRPPMAVDLNGDGIQEIVQTDWFAQNVQTVKALRVNPDGASFSWSDLNVPNGQFQFGDLDGDGLPDLVGQPKASSGSSTSAPNGLFHFIHQGGKPDLLTRARDGMGRFEEFVYKPVSDPSVYTATAEQIPSELLLVKRGLWVVAEHRSGYDATTVKTLQYQYEDGWFNKQGRGWLGFSRRTVLDPLSGAKQDTRYSVTESPGFGVYPLANSPSSDVYSIQVGSLRHELSRSLTYGHRFASGSGIYSRAWEQVVETTREWRSADDDDVVIKRRVTTNNQYDLFGALSESDVYSEWGFNGTTSTLHSTVATSIQNGNTPSSWIIGRPTRVAVTSTDESGAQITRTKAFSWDPASGLLSGEMTEPDSYFTSDTALFKSITYLRNTYGQTTGIQSSDKTQGFRSEGIRYDDFDHTYPTAVINFYGHTTRLSYHRGLGVLCALDTPQFRPYEWYYDGFGRTRQGRRFESSADGPSWSDTYSFYSVIPGSGLLNTTVFPTGLTAYVLYDKLNREIVRRVQGPERAVVSTMEYDDLGRLQRASVPHDDFQTPVYYQFAYDVLGRLLEKTRPDGLVVERHEYAPFDMTSWDAEGRKRQVVLNGLGRVEQSREFAAGDRPLVTQYQYGPFGSLKGVTDSGGNQTSMEYDILGRRTSLNDPDMGLQTTKYNGLGNLVEQQDASGAVIHYSYDYEGRITEVSTKTTPTSTAQVSTFTWDTADNAPGLLAETTSSDGVRIQYAYDSLARPVNRTWTINGQSFQMDQSYDQLGRVSTLSYPRMPDGSRLSVGLQYDSFGNVSSIQDPMGASVGWTADSWTALGQLETESFQNNIKTSRQFDELGQLRGIDTKLGTSSRQTMAYDYSPNGNVILRQDLLGGTNEDFGYDSLNRLSSWTIRDAGGSKPTEYQYDDLGNLTGINANYTGGTSTSLQYSGGHPHAVTQSTWGSYLYDANGNQVSAPARTVTYTPFNLPQRIASASTGKNYRYDSFNTRTVALGDNGDEILSLGGLYERRTLSGERSHVFLIQNDGRQLAQVIWKEQGFPKQKTYYFHGDSLGSVTLVTDNQTSGAVFALQKYSPLGEERSPYSISQPQNWLPSEVRVAFTAQEKEDEFGLINMRGRMYEPRLGRFLSPDPLVMDPLLGQAYNRYSYVLNNPLRFTDPSGFSPELSDSWDGNSLYFTGFGLIVSGAGYLLGGGGGQKVGASPGTAQGLPLSGVAPTQGSFYESSVAAGMVVANFGLQQAVFSLGAAAGAGRMVGGLAYGVYATAEDPLYPFLASWSMAAAGYSEDGVSGAFNAFNPVSAVLKTAYVSNLNWDRGQYYESGAFACMATVTAVGTLYGAESVAVGATAAMGLAGGVETEAVEAALSPKTELPDSALVCRGGTCQAEAFRTGSGVEVAPDGTLRGISTQSKAGASIEELAQRFQNNQVGVTTVGEIRGAGGEVVPDGTPRNPNHATVNGITAEQAERLFTPTIPNPVPKPLRYKPPGR